MQVYKVLYGPNKSQYQGMIWPVPDGAIPGDWVEVDESDHKLEVCHWGLHGWLTEEKAVSAGRNKSPSDFKVYEMELEGEIKQDREKACALRGRLVRLLQDQNGPVIGLDELIWQ